MQGSLQSKALDPHSPVPPGREAAATTTAQLPTHPSTSAVSGCSSSVAAGTPKGRCSRGAWGGVSTASPHLTDPWALPSMSAPLPGRPPVLSWLSFGWGVVLPL